MCNLVVLLLEKGQLTQREREGWREEGKECVREGGGRKGVYRKKRGKEGGREGGEKERECDVLFCPGSRLYQGLEWISAQTRSL